MDWTHAQFAPLTMDVIHLLFGSAGGDIAEYITEALNVYYDTLKVRMLIVVQLSSKTGC